MLRLLKEFVLWVSVHEELSLVLVSYAYPILAGLFFLTIFNILLKRPIIRSMLTRYLVAMSCLMASLGYTCLALTVGTEPVLHLNDGEILPLLRIFISLFALFWVLSVITDTIVLFKELSNDVRIRNSDVIDRAFVKYAYGEKGPPQKREDYQLALDASWFVLPDLHHPSKDNSHQASG